jgi:hypothetical protein
MATPITHIVLTDKIFKDKFSNFDRKDFYIGTSFPDIRYLKVIDRDTTHFKDKKLNIGSLNQDNSFIAGAEFHVIVDKIREDYVISNKTYEFLPKSKYINQSLKFLEDELLFDKVKDWGKIIDDFGSINFEKIGFELDKKYIKNWYSLLCEYFSIKPNSETRKKFITKIGFSEEDANKMNNLVDIMKNNKRVKDVIYSLYDQFDLLLEKFVNKGE